MKIPYLFIVGPRDQEQQAVSVRAHGIQKDLGAAPLDTLLETLQAEITTRGRRTVTGELFGDAD